MVSNVFKYHIFIALPINDGNLYKLVTVNIPARENSNKARRLNAKMKTQKVQRAQIAHAISYFRFERLTSFTSFILLPVVGKRVYMLVC